MPGSDVRYRGYKVGKVMKILPNPNDVKVHLMIQPDIKVPEGSTLRVAFDGLIGQKYVEIMPSTEGPSLKNGDVIPGFSTLGLVDFIDIGTQNLEESKQILSAVRKITNDPAVQSAAKSTLVNIEKTTYELNLMVANLSKALSKGGFENLISSMSSASANIDRISKELDTILVATGKLTNDPEFTSDIKDTVKNAKDAFDELKKASQDASKVLKKYSK
jgi:phospholipid/cholesterol/gamma-HCH transport system substrate-binding protein